MIFTYVFSLKCMKNPKNPFGEHVSLLVSARLDNLELQVLKVAVDKELLRPESAQVGNVRDGHNDHLFDIVERVLVAVHIAIKIVGLYLDFNPFSKHKNR